MKIPCRKYLFQLHPWPFMCTQMIISSSENSEENVIFLPCFSTEFARYYLTGNKQKIARRTVYFSTSVRPVMFRLWYDYCTLQRFPGSYIYLPTSFIIFIGLIPLLSESNCHFSFQICSYSTLPIKTTELHDRILDVWRFLCQQKGGIK